MGRIAKSKSKERRKKLKKARKEANQAKYDAWKKAGTNTKSKRARSRIQKNKLVNLVKHSNGECGNPPCKKCYPNSLWNQRGA